MYVGRTVSYVLCMYTEEDEMAFLSQRSNQTCCTGSYRPCPPSPPSLPSLSLLLHTPFECSCGPLP